MENKGLLFSVMVPVENPSVDRTEKKRKKTQRVVENYSLPKRFQPTTLAMFTGMKTVAVRNERVTG